MRWRGVSHVEFAVLDYEKSVAFYDSMLGWLGYESFSSLDMEYESTYYMTRYLNPHSYIGIQPAASGSRLVHADQSVGINHIALWARGRSEIDQFHREFLVERHIAVTDEPKDYPQYHPGYYAVFFDDPINGIHWELAWVPRIPSPRQVLAYYQALRGFARDRQDLANTVPGLFLQARRRLPRR
jgi:catechol 2,3-dioxygenase-like lactoylglutathione lyase family enzyme